MCLAPKYFWKADGEGGRYVEVACRRCWQCMTWFRHDWEGRCIAESRSAVATSFVTLTYGRDLATDSADHPAAVLLTYSHVQKYLKLLRRHGFPCRFFCAGEFGSLKGRAHWHLLLFWQREKPGDVSKWFPAGIEQGVRWVDEVHWDRGWSYWRDMSLPDVRYVCKYIGKDVLAEEGRQQTARYSVDPPLGVPFFRGLARRYVEQGLAPQKLEYHFPDVLDRKGKPARFYIFGVCKRYFLEAFIDAWGDLRPDEDMPRSQLVEDFMESLDYNRPPRVRRRRGEAAPPPDFSAAGYGTKAYARSRRARDIFPGADFLPTDHWLHSHEYPATYVDDVQLDRQRWEKQRMDGTRTYWFTAEEIKRGQEVEQEGVEPDNTQGVGAEGSGDGAALAHGTGQEGGSGVVAEVLRRQAEQRAARELVEAADDDGSGQSS